MSNRAHKPSLAAAALAGLAAIALLLAGTAEARVMFKLPGRGFGHGVGMSQWGAYGYAKQGRGHRWIVQHYYKGAKVKKLKRSRDVKVLLSVRPGSVAFSNARRACGRPLRPSRTYVGELSPSGRKVRLENGSGRKLTSCGGILRAKSKGAIRIDGEGTYRGGLNAKPSGGSLNVINKVGLEAYVKGVIPNEMPSSWSNAALRAQAVAARSYAIATERRGGDFDHYDDTRSQVYVGKATEQASTNKATRNTRHQVVRYGGAVVPTYFFSSSGGRTENSEFGFSGGSAQPYLKSVKDPYERASPYHRWKLTYTRAELQGALGDFVRGRLKKVRITKTGRSPRVVRAKVIGSAGKTTVSGDDLRSRLGLRSTWVKFRKVRK